MYGRAKSAACCESFTQPLAHQLLPLHAAQLLGQQARGHKHQIVVLKDFAKIPAGLEVAQALEHLLPGQAAGVPQRVVARQARAVDHQIARSDTLGGHAIVKLKPGQIIADGFVPFELLLFGQHAQHGHGERLGDGADGKQRLRGRRLLAFDVAETVAAGKNHFAVADDGHGHARRFPILERLTDEGVHALERRLGRNHRRGTLPCRRIFRWRLRRYRYCKQRQHKQPQCAHPGRATHRDTSLRITNRAD
jgi:hypothetical protein